MQPKSGHTFGFSLVELSIVLVILGLLVGGVLSGQALIKAAELKSIETRMAQAQTAYLSFRDKYFYFPGDMPNATQFWGTDPTGCPSSSATPRRETCNGDGDGKLGTDESCRSWQQLADAGLIDGSYTGDCWNHSGNGITAGVSMLGTKRNNVGITIIYQGAGGGNQYAFDRPYEGNLMSIGASTWNSPYSQLAGLSVVETYALDTKMDDGVPQSGKIMSVGTWQWNPYCVDASNAAYAVSLGDAIDTNNRGPGCEIFFKWY